MHGPHHSTAQHVPALSHEQMLCCQGVAGVGVVMVIDCGGVVGGRIGIVRLK